MSRNEAKRGGSQNNVSFTESELVSKNFLTSTLLTRYYFSHEKGERLIGTNKDVGSKGERRDR